MIAVMMGIENRALPMNNWIILGRCCLYQLSTTLIVGRCCLSTTRAALTLFSQNAPSSMKSMVRIFVFCILYLVTSTKQDVSIDNPKIFVRSEEGQFKDNSISDQNSAI